MKDVTSLTVAEHVRYRRHGDISQPQHCSMSSLFQTWIYQGTKRTVTYFSAMWYHKHSACIPGCLDHAHLDQLLSTLLSLNSFPAPLTLWT